MEDDHRCDIERRRQDIELVALTTLDCLAGAMRQFTSIASGVNMTVTLEEMQERQRRVHDAISSAELDVLPDAGAEIIERIFSFLASILGRDLLGLAGPTSEKTPVETRSAARRIVLAIRRGLEAGAHKKIGSPVSELDDGLRALMVGEVQPILERGLKVGKSRNAFTVAAIKYAVLLIRRDLIASGRTAAQADYDIGYGLEVEPDSVARWRSQISAILAPRDVARIELDHHQRFGLPNPTAQAALRADLRRLRDLYRHNKVSS